MRQREASIGKQLQLVENTVGDSPVKSGATGVKLYASACTKIKMKMKIIVIRLINGSTSKSVGRYTECVYVR